MAALSLLGGILFWAYIWNKWHRPRKPVQAKPDDRPIIYDAEEREALYNEVLLRMLEDGETEDIARRVAESLVQAYDRKAIKPAEASQKQAISDRT